MLQIVGKITLTTHGHQTSPDKGGGGTNYTMKTYVWDEGVQHEVPFFTANSVRGLIRRRAAERVLKALNAKVSRELFHVLMRGAGGRTSIGGEASAKVHLDASRNVFAGIFGGGGYMLHSLYSVSPLLPLIAWCHESIHPALQNDIIPADRLRYRKVGDDGVVALGGDIPLTTLIIMAPRDDLMEGKGQEYVLNYQESLDAWLASVSQTGAEKAKQKKAAEDARKRGEKGTVVTAKANDLRGMLEIESVLPGTPLQFSVRVQDDASQAQVGLLLLAIQDWANANVLGGASARGFGRFKADLSLYDNNRLIAPIFNPGEDALAYTLTAAMKPWADAANDSLAKLTVEGLNEVFCIDDVKAAKHA